MGNTVEINVACENFQETLWAKDFYPEDLPKDWIFDFYANEFQSVLINQKINIADLLLNIEESFSEAFLLVLDITEKAAVEIFLQQSSSLNDELSIDYVVEFEPLNLLDIYASKLDHDDLKNTISISSSLSHGQRLIFKVQTTQLLHPKELKMVVDNCLDSAKKQSKDSILIFFGDNLYTIEQARNMILLSQLL